jgi:3-oxoacid CoA-transferase subunit A
MNKRAQPIFGSTMIYLTGDTHGDFDRVELFCEKYKTTKDDVLVVLGDAGINYSADTRDKDLKTSISRMPIILLCIHGNHEQRPENLPTYEKTEKFGGTVYWEPEFPDLLFAKDGEVYGLNGKQCI